LQVELALLYTTLDTTMYALNIGLFIMGPVVQALLKSLANQDTFNNNCYSNEDLQEDWKNLRVLNAIYTRLLRLAVNLKNYAVQINVVYDTVTW